MNTTEQQTRVFESLRSQLMGLAYRMLGSWSDSEDIVQEAWIRWVSANVASVENEEPFLKTVVTRLCIDRIRKDKDRRENYTGQWLPDPVEHAEQYCPRNSADYADDLSYALMLALERLSALERAAFLLHDVFDFSFSEVAAVLERNESAVRQLASRARKSVRESRPPKDRVCPKTHQKLLDAFVGTLKSGDVDSFSRLLREDAVYIADSGGHHPAALRPILGREKISRLFFSQSANMAGRDDSASWGQYINVNGAQSILIFSGRSPSMLISLSVEGERIVAIYMLSNPAKLAGLQADASNALPENL